MLCFFIYSIIKLFIYYYVFYLFFQLWFLFLGFPFYSQNCLFFFRRCYPYDIYLFFSYVFEHLKQNCFHIVLFSTSFNMWIPLFVETPGSHGGLFPWEFQIFDFGSIFRLNCFWTCVMIQEAILCLPVSLPWISQPVFTIISWLEILLPSLICEFNPLSPHSISLDFSRMIDFQPQPRTGSPFFLPNSQFSGKNFCSPFQALNFTLGMHL